MTKIRHHQWVESLFILSTVRFSLVPFIKTSFFFWKSFPVLFRGKSAGKENVVVKKKDRRVFWEERIIYEFVFQVLSKYKRPNLLL